MFGLETKRGLWKWITLILGVILLMLFTLSYFMFPEENSITWLYVIRQTFIGLGAALMSAFLIDKAITRWAVRDLQSVTRETLEEAIGDLKVLHGCLEAGVINVFPTRAEFYEHFADRLLYLPKDTNVQIIGISLRDFFQQGAPGEDAINSLRDAVDHSITENKLRYRLCLLDPLSSPGAQRSYREELDTVTHISRTGLFRDVSQAIDRYIINYRQGNINCPKFRVEDYSASEESQWRPRWESAKCEDCTETVCMCLYRTSPSCFLAVLPDSIYYEQYHYGLTGGERKGGQAPVLQIGRNARADMHLRGHFEYTWSSGRYVTRKVSEILEDQHEQDRENMHNR